MQRKPKQMTGEEFKSIRLSLSCSLYELADALGTPYNTVRDWEHGNSRIPGIVPVTLSLMQEKDRWTTEKITADLNRKLDRMYPHGIQSLPDRLM